MTSFESLGDGRHRMAPGRYAFIAQGWNGTACDPRAEAEHGDCLLLPVTDEPTVAVVGGMEMLVIPAGLDKGGAKGRSIDFGLGSMAVFERMAIVRCDEAQSRRNVYCTDVHSVIAFDVFEDEAEVDAAAGGFDLHMVGGTDGASLTEVGAFIIQGEFFSMEEPSHAAAFDYGSDAFNAGLDEHGFFVDVPQVLARLRGKTDRESSALRKTLESVPDGCYAHHASVTAD